MESSGTHPNQDDCLRILSTQVTANGLYKFEVEEQGWNPQRNPRYIFGPNDPAWHLALDGLSAEDWGF